MAEDDVDFVVAAYRDGGEWTAIELAPRLGEDLEALLEALLRFPSEVGVIGMASVNDDFFVIVRRSGTHIRALLSDATAIRDWPLASDVSDLVRRTDLGDDPVPMGDLELLEDLGLSSVELSLLCEDDDLFPDDVLIDVATRIGFGDQMVEIVG